MKAYSMDLREKVLRAVDQGYPRGEIVKLLGVSRATIKRYLKQRRETGDVAPKAIPGRPPKKLYSLQAELVAQLQAHDAPPSGGSVSLMGTKPRGESQPVDDERGHQASRLDTKKKTLGATERREDERASFREQMKQVDARRFVVVDECGCNIALTPLYARAPKGQRAYGSVPRNRGKNTTLLASLSLTGIGECMIIEGSVNALAFEAYVEHILAPSLEAGQIVVLDNLSVHKGVRVATAHRSPRL